MSTAHNVFVSYHHQYDERYRNEFERILGNRIISRTVDYGDIDPTNKTESIMRQIRDDHIKNATVCVVLIGQYTWQRKYVDWEIASSIRATQANPRTGLLGIYLPTHPDHGKENVYRYTIPPRLADNWSVKYAKLYDWMSDTATLERIIDDAFHRKDSINPINKRPLFGKNRTGDRWYD